MSLVFALPESTLRITSNSAKLIAYKRANETHKLPVTRQ